MASIHSLACAAGLDDPLSPSKPEAQARGIRGAFQLCLSVALYAEWHDALLRPEHAIPGTSPEMTLGFLRYIASQAHLQEIYFLWRPFLPDADDDTILELAVAAQCRIIVTHNVRDFAGADQFGIECMPPGDFLRLLRGIS